VSRIDHPPLLTALPHRRQQPRGTERSRRQFARELVQGLRAADPWPRPQRLRALSRTRTPRAWTPTLRGRTTWPPPEMLVASAKRCALRGGFRYRPTASRTPSPSKLAKGRELLEAGFAPEASRELSTVRGQEHAAHTLLGGLAATHHRLGHTEDSERCRQMAQGIHESLEYSRIEAAVRTERWLWRRRR